MSFSLWIETEHVLDPITDFCNVLVSFDGGAEWALNVWTFDFFATARNEPELAASAELAHTYMRPPDLFVSDLSRSTLERVLSDIVSQGGAPNHWRTEFSMDELSFGLAVKISDACTDVEIAGKFGRLAGIARDPEADSVASYAVHIHDLDRVWSVDPTHVAPA